MKIKCTSCGALQNNTIGQSCEFCGNILVYQEENIIDRKINLVKAELAGLNLNSLSYKSRNINKINEIISVHPDNEIEAVRSLMLQNNKINSLKGISRFTLSLISLENNDIIFIDDFPNLKTEYFRYCLKSRTDGIYLDFRNNKNLESITDFAIEKINKSKDVYKFEILLIGCPKFDYDKLCNIDFKKILEAFEIGNKAVIVPDSTAELPNSLKEIGFVVIPEYKINFDGNQKTTICWEYNPPLLERIKIGEYGLQNLEKYKVEIIAKEFKRSGDKNITVIKAKEMYTNIDDLTAMKLIDDILETKSLFPMVSNSQIEKKNCFIATTTMGDYNHPVVIDLRLFRDNWLLKRNWGVNFTNWYYKHGPKASAVIERSVVLKKLTFIFIVKPLQLLTKKLR